MMASDRTHFHIQEDKLAYLRRPKKVHAEVSCEAQVVPETRFPQWHRQIRHAVVVEQRLGGAVE